MPEYLVQVELGLAPAHDACADLVHPKSVIQLVEYQVADVVGAPLVLPDDFAGMEPDGDRTLVHGVI